MDRGALPETLYSLDYQVAWTSRVSDRCSSLVVFNPVLENGSETSLKPKDFKFSGGLLVTSTSARKTVGLGVAWSRVFGHGMLLPLVHLAWKDTSFTVVGIPDDAARQCRTLVLPTSKLAGRFRC